jgi:hypothetical protein
LFNEFFQSDDEGVTAFVPFGGATTIIEDGTVQTAATIPLTGTGQGNLIIQFQSDIRPFPELRSIGLLSLVVLGVALIAKRRALS